MLRILQFSQSWENVAWTLRTTWTSLYLPWRRVIFRTTQKCPLVCVRAYQGCRTRGLMAMGSAWWRSSSAEKQINILPYALKRLGMALPTLNWGMMSPPQRGGNDAMPTLTPLQDEGERGASLWSNWTAYDTEIPGRVYQGAWHPAAQECIGSNNLPHIIQLTNYTSQ